MMQAQSSYARNWNTYEIPQTVVTGKPAQDTVRPTNYRTAGKKAFKVDHKRKLFIKSAAIIFGYALVLVFLCMKSAALGYQIEKLEADVQNIETANHRLDYQIAEKSSLARVEQVASSQLGMYKPESKSSLAMEVQTEPVQVASAANSGGEASISHQLSNLMYNSWARLAQNDQ